MNVQFYNLFRREDYNAEDNSDIRPIIGRLTPKNIADYLLQNIWEINGKYEWVTLQYFKSDIRLGAADHYLYGGISGLAVFFAAMNIKYDNAIYRLTFERIVYQIRLHTDNDAGKGDEWGLFTGEASIIYTYLLLYKIIEDNIYLVYAQKQADRMMGKDLSTIEGDDLLGGKAGVIIAYLSLYGFTDDRRYLEFAIIIGERLLAGGGKREKGIGWFNSGQSNLAGIAHGNSGIALACAFLWKYCKSGRYIQYIKEAIDYEDILYNAKLCNWQDIREHEAEKDMVAWCHGCGGIFLARKKIHELTGIPLEELFSVIAVKNDNQNAELDYVWNVLEEKMFAAKKEEGCLCHGSLGVYVLLKQINKEKAEIYRKEIKNYSLSFEDMNNVGFMNGIAGIGYTLLDEDNFEVPNVLNLGVLTEN